jgi:V8-like Glu-specific endopeptidase
LPIELKAGRLEHKASENYKNKHPFDIADIKDLPKAINEPIAVFNSTKNDGAKIILTDLKDKNGNNFVAVIKMYKEALGKKNSLDINSIVSVYPKDNIAELTSWFKSGNKLVAWQDKEKASRFTSSQSPIAIAREHETEALEHEAPTSKYTKISEKKQELNDNSEKNPA